MRFGTYDELPALAAYDLNEAAVCIAFERPTAAAFHALRSTEGVLRHYYRCVIRQRRLAKPWWLWKAMLEDLEKPGRRRRPPKSLIDHLNREPLRPVCLGDRVDDCRCSLDHARRCGESPPSSGQLDLGQLARSIQKGSGVRSCFPTILTRGFVRYPTPIAPRRQFAPVCDASSARRGQTEGLRGCRDREIPRASEGPPRTEGRREPRQGLRPLALVRGRAGTLRRLGGGG
jgi:hypothetical protein